MIHLTYTRPACWIIAASVLSAWVSAAAVSPAGSRSDLSLDSLVRIAEARNPQIAAARARAAQASAARSKLRGFFDPTVTGAAKRYGGNLGSAFEASGEVQVPFRPGFYLKFGAAEDRLSDTGTGDDNLYQTTLSAGIDIPLLRDCGFRQWRLEDAEAEAAWRAARHHLTAVEQAVRHLIEQRYIAMLEAHATYRITQAATARVERLLAEAKELVRLKVVPEYQLFVAKMEVALARATERSAEQGFSRSVQSLLQAVGLEGPRTFHPADDALVHWADTASMPARIPLQEALKRRGDYLESQALAESVRLRLARARDDLRPDLTISGEVAWKGQASDFPVATGRLASDRHDGSLVMLTWRRPLGFRGERAELGRQAARLRQQTALARSIEIDIRTDLSVAWRDILAAREELALVTEAVTEARGNLASEGERFRLGEGRSRNVLDAQKDLTNVIQRQARIAASLLRAVSNYLYAAGYPTSLESPPMTAADRQP